jgi:hypothetical protein
MPNITQTTGTVTSYGVYVNGGTVTSGTQYAILVDSGDMKLDGKLFQNPENVSGVSGITNSWFVQASGTYTDSATAGAGTATLFAFNVWNAPTLAATNAGVTTTDAATCYITGYPANGGNMTITNPWALWVEAGNVRFDGTLTLGNDADNVSGQINFIASDGDAANIAINTSDQLTFNSAGGGYIFDGNLSVAGANFRGRVAVGAADYNPSALTDDYIVAVDNTAAARAVIISAEDKATGTTAIPRIFVIKDESGACGTNNITVSLEGGGTIDGEATYVMSSDDDAITLYIDGTNAWVI